MASLWFIYLVVGRILIYLGMKFPLPDYLNNIEKIRKLHECPLCLGVWVYALLSFFMQMDLLGALGFHYVPVVSEIVTGCVISFIVHIFILGWKSQFEVIVV